MAVFMRHQSKGAFASASGEKVRFESALGTKARRIARRAMDVLLAALLLLQMGYQLLPEDVHAALGIAMVLAAAAHLVLNRAWFGSLVHGKPGPVRVLVAFGACASALLVAVLGLSGFALSGVAPALRSFDGLARSAHLVASYVALLVLPFHAGLHLSSLLGGALGRGKAKGSAVPRRVGVIAWAIVACVGAYEFAALHVWGYVTLNFPFVLPAEGPLAVYLLEHFTVMSLFALLGAAMAYALRSYERAANGTRGIAVSRCR